MVLSTFTALADFTPDFGAAPYAMDQTILGVDNWEYRLPDREQNTPESARVVQLPGNQLKPGLEIKGANLMNTGFPATTGDKMSVSFSLALEIPTYKPSGRTFRLFLGGAPVGEIYYEEGEEGGFGYGGENDGRGAGTIFLPQAEIGENSFYTITLDIDGASLNYDITVKGIKGDGSPFNFEAKGVPFTGKVLTSPVAVTGIFMISTPRLTVYMGSLAIESK